MAILNPKEAARKIRAISGVYSTKQDAIEIPALETLRGILDQRIFVYGRAADGRSIGRYRSKAYKKRRLAAGKQVRYKDLEFYGDLRRNIITGKSGRYNAIGFANNKARIIADRQEEYSANRPIFNFNSKDLKILSKAISTGLRKLAEKQ